MATLTNRPPSFPQVFREARRLSTKDQRRLCEELARLTGVRLVRPSNSASAVRAGLALADEIREELESTASESVDEAMRKMRGRGWS